VRFFIAAYIRLPFVYLNVIGPNFAGYTLRSHSDKQTRIENSGRTGSDHIQGERMRTHKPIVYQPERVKRNPYALHASKRIAVRFPSKRSKLRERAASDHIQ
jgi:hypothetical protein